MADGRYIVTIVWWRWRYLSVISVLVFPTCKKKLWVNESSVQEVLICWKMENINELLLSAKINAPLLLEVGPGNDKQYRFLTSPSTFIARRPNFEAMKNFLRALFGPFFVESPVRFIEWIPELLTSLINFFPPPPLPPHFWPCAHEFFFRNSQRSNEFYPFLVRMKSLMSANATATGLRSAKVVSRTIIFEKRYAT